MGPSHETMHLLDATSELLLCNATFRVKPALFPLMLQTLLIYILRETWLTEAVLSLESIQDIVFKGKN